MTLPKQCEECALLEICLDNGCIKAKPCSSRTLPAPVDDDLYAEMAERSME